MRGPVICGVDDSSEARAAAAAATAIAVRAGLPLLFVHVAPDDRRRTVSDPERKRRLGESVSLGIELLERAVPRAARRQGAVTRVAVGDPAAQLAAVAASTGAEIVVVGSRRRGAFKAALMGSISRRLLSLCECPVLIVPRGARLPEARLKTGAARPLSVVCGIGPSERCLRAAEIGSRLAARLHGRLVLAHVYPPLRRSLAGSYEATPALARWKAAPDLLSEATEALRSAPGPDPELRLEPGDACRSLIGLARREHAELLVLGSSRESAGPYRSLVEKIAVASPVPVLVVPPLGEPAEAAVEPALDHHGWIATASVAGPGATRSDQAA